MPKAQRKTINHSQVLCSTADRETPLEDRIAELEAELRARDDFLAIAAHELRNPMTPIRGRVELLLARARRAPETVPKPIVRGLEEIERLVDAYIRRATVLLDVSRLNSGNISLQIEQVEVSTLIERAAMSMIPMAERAGSEVRLNLQEGIKGHCDETAMEQILENLLSNAIRYGCGQPIEVDLSRHADTVVLSVTDHGVGISDQDQAQIFDRFWKLNHNKTNGGFGVGLWLTRQLVQVLRGEIAVASKPGIGSTFTVTLPLSPHDKANAH